MKKIDHQIFYGVECKHCSGCKVFKTLHCFSNSSVYRDGLSSVCRDCKRSPVALVCVTCGKIHFRRYCKECGNCYNKRLAKVSVAYKESQKAYELKRKKPLIQKVCRICTSSFESRFKRQWRCQQCLKLIKEKLLSTHSRLAPNYKNWKRKQYSRREHKTVTCFVCGVHFEQKHKKQLICSIGCSKSRKWLVREYRNRDVEKRRFYNRQREMRDKAAGKLLFYEWKKLKEAFRFTCPSCLQVEPDIKLTIDHIVPVSKGGTNDIQNIQPLCLICNIKKGVKIKKYALATS